MIIVFFIIPFQKTKISRRRNTPNRKRGGRQALIFEWPKFDKINILLFLCYTTIVNTTKSSLVFFFSITIVLSLGTYFVYTKNNTDPLINNSAPLEETVVEYKNTDYGFTFSLPDNWLGYSVETDTWTGNPLGSSATSEMGPKFLIRNPKWTHDTPYQDIPILVFTLTQWGAYQNENFAVSAAPIPATELARNNVYVFALPPRWDFDYKQDYKEAQDIVRSNPLQAFEISSAMILEEGQYCYVYHHEGTKEEPYTVDELVGIYVQGGIVDGMKTGTQSGPDMTNGYSGTLAGTIQKNMIDVVFAYTIEGSSSKEKEIYRVKDDLSGIEKLRYPLEEKNGVLVPDRTKEFEALFYAQISCETSD